ncbi:MAG: hypothetical protein EKK40_03720 [Bradyrhizobiaceae bacterium]|nr:MAG: hypothetical protein EKK40_03720 [Bradyrhizobiaceae bacterium]
MGAPKSGSLACRGNLDVVANASNHNDISIAYESVLNLFRECKSYLKNEKAQPKSRAYSLTVIPEVMASGTAAYPPSFFEARKKARAS